MANVLTQNIWNCDSMGILATYPVVIRAIAVHPADVSQVITLKWWDEVKPPTLRSTAVTTTITTSTDNTITASGGTPFPNTWLDGNVIRCTKSSNYNTGTYGLIKTAGNNTVLVTHLAPYTNDAAAVGDWDCYPSYTAFTHTGQTIADSHETKLYTFDGYGLKVPNLALDFLSASATVIIYVE